MLCFQLRIISSLGQRSFIIVTTYLSIVLSMRCILRFWFRKVVEEDSHSYFCLVRLRTFGWIFSVLILLRFGGARPTRLRGSAPLTVTRVRDPRAFDLLWLFLLSSFWSGTVELWDGEGRSLAFPSRRILELGLVEYLFQFLLSGAEGGELGVDEDVFS